MYQCNYAIISIFLVSVLDKLWKASKQQQGGNKQHPKFVKEGYKKFSLPGKTKKTTPAIFTRI